MVGAGKKSPGPATGPEWSGCFLFPQNSNYGEPLDMIEVSDTLRVHKFKHRTGYVRWRLLEWEPGPTLDGHWRPTTVNLTAPAMYANLERKYRPSEMLQQFRIAAQERLKR